MEKVDDFLYNSLGYRKIAEFLDSKKDIGDFIGGTIFGTFRANNAVAKPQIPKIMKLDDLEAGNSSSEKTHYRSPENRLFCIDSDSLQMNLHYLIYSPFFFGTHTLKGIKDTVSWFNKKVFPGNEYKMDTAGSEFRVKLPAENFCFNLYGSAKRNSFKNMVILFNTEQSTVDNINDIVSRYDNMEEKAKKSFGYIDVTKPKPVEEPVVEKPKRSRKSKFEPKDTVYPDITDKEKKMSNEKLDELLKSCHAFKYDTNIRFYKGNVIDHPWGVGFVIESKYRITVRFPGIKGKKESIKTLVHNRNK